MDGNVEVLPQCPGTYAQGSWYQEKMALFLLVVSRLGGGPHDPDLWKGTPLCDPLLLNIGGTCDLLLTSRLWQR